MDDELPRHRWVPVRSRSEQWSLIDERDESGRTLRHITKLGPYLGTPEPVYRLYLDEGYEDYRSRDEAMEAGIASLR